MSTLSIPTTTRDANGLHDVLQQLVTGVRKQLGGNYVGAYLQGSMATGDFDNASDIDFIVATKDDVPQAVVPTLQTFHQTLYDTHSSYWARHLEGSYMPLRVLQQLPPPQQKVLYLDHGSTTFEYSDHDHYLAVLWILRERGVVLDGPDPKTLVAPVPAQLLKQETMKTMRWWADLIIGNEDEMALHWYQTFAVLSYCRMANTVVTGEVNSKKHGTIWAQAVMDEKWHSLITNAVEERLNPSREMMGSADPAAKAETIAFIGYVMAFLA